MHRRSFLQTGLSAVAATAWSLARVEADVQAQRFEAAAEVLSQAVSRQQLAAAALYVDHKQAVTSHVFGAADSQDDMFLIASISKPMTVAALMTLYEQNEFQLDTPAQRFLPEFRGQGRERITVRQLLTHVSGLPDQLPENTELRKGHAPLSEFVQGALRTPLLFAPGSRYSYSSMAILLASEIAARVSGMPFPAFLAQQIFAPLQMTRSVLGIGPFRLANLMRCQTEQAAPESGAGNPEATDWDWNSPYWRRFGAPWGGVHASAADVGRFLAEFLRTEGQVFRPATARLICQNHNHPALTPRGLGFALGTRAGCPGCSNEVFGHTGSTGTLAWADPASDTICVVLTTLPGRAADPHPRTLAARQVADVVR